jgi:hypothetical protein
MGLDVVIIILIIIILIIFLLFRMRSDATKYLQNVKAQITSKTEGKQNTKEDETLPRSLIECEKKTVTTNTELPEPGDPNFPVLSKVPPEQRGFGPDCYLFPNSCPKDHFCMLADRSRWSTQENGTRGVCRPYQKECYSCTDSYEDSLLNRERYPALGATSFDQQGEYHKRQTVCAPDLVCTGNNIPTLPATCVIRRPKGRMGPPSRDEFIQWCLAFVRLGGRPSKGLTDRQCRNHNQDGICVRYHDKVSPLTKGASREEILKTANNILKTLWPEKLGPYPGEFVPGLHDADVPGCDESQYINQLKDYQKANGGPEYRAPSGHPEKENPPRCLYKDVDYAYNDEAPSIWSLIHTITANLPDILTPEQVEALRMIPLYLRKYFSCPDCRGNIKEHIIDIGLPDSNYRHEWFKHFHRAHNIVNEQATKIRYGENMGAGYPWAKESSICAGKYAEPWYLSLGDALDQWTIK